MKIVMKTIPHSEQRYPTFGDYWEDEDGTIQIRSSSFLEESQEVLVLLHEFVEFFLCRARGIPEKAIREFDEAFEEGNFIGEPGDCLNAPYYIEHQFAQAMEMMMCQEFGMTWHEWEEEQCRVWDSCQTPKGEKV